MLTFCTKHYSEKLAILVAFPWCITLCSEKERMHKNFRAKSEDKNNALRKLRRLKNKDF